MADSPTGREPPTAHEQWVLLHGGQGGTSLEYQTYTSAHPFDTIVAGLPPPRDSLSEWVSLKQSFATATDGMVVGDREFCKFCLGRSSDPASPIHTFIIQL